MPIKWDKIDYNHFNIETKYEMDKKWSVYINPHDMAFYTSNHVYFALSFPSPSEIYVCMVQGAGKNTNYIDGLRSFIKWSRMCGIQTIRFGTYLKNTKMITFYKYIKANYVRSIEDYYEDNDSYVEYLLDLSKTNRFK